MQIDICICTFRRSHIAHTLASLQEMERPERVRLRILVADNDETDSARDMVSASAGDVPVHYIHAPARNISIARNACLDAALGDWVAFIDDDERAEPGWLTALLAEARASGADGVFGPAYAVYGENAPDWMREGDYHSNLPELRDGEVQTGHTCNALLRWQGSPWQDQRFDLARGQTGGEDTEFFFRLHGLGARYALAWEAVVHEDVEPARMSYDWLKARKFRSGHSYAASANGAGRKLTLFVTAAAKAMISSAMSLVMLPSEGRRNFWALRAALHRGVCAGCLSLKERAHYGQ